MIKHTGRNDRAIAFLPLLPEANLVPKMFETGGTPSADDLLVTERGEAVKRELVPDNTRLGMLSSALRRHSIHVQRQRKKQ